MGVDVPVAPGIPLGGGMELEEGMMVGSVLDMVSFFRGRWLDEDEAGKKSKMISEFEPRE